MGKVRNGFKTGARWTRAFAVLGLTGFLFFKGFACAGGAYNGVRMGLKARKVQKVIDFGDYAAANELLVSFHKKGVLKPEDVGDLRANIIKGVELEKFENALNDYDLDSARVVLSEIKSSGLFPDSVVGNLGKEVYDLTEEGMFKRINSDSRDLALEYLNLYPDTPRIDEVVKGVLTNDFNSLSAYLEETSYFLDAYIKLFDINSLLEKYSGEGVVLSDVIPADDFVSLSHDYLERTKEFREGEISVGSEVKTVSVPRSELPWHEEYFRERNATVPPGFVGEVIAAGDNGFMVRFKGVDSYAWKRNWNPDSKYWEDGKKNVAEYKYKELLVRPNINDVQRENFEEQVDRLAENLRVYL